RGGAWLGRRILDRGLAAPRRRQRVLDGTGGGLRPGRGAARGLIPDRPTMRYIRRWRATVATNGTESRDDARRELKQLQDTVGALRNELEESVAAREEAVQAACATRDAEIRQL